MIHPTDWTSHRLQGQSTRPGKEAAYLLEMIEFDFSDKTGSILLFCPGYFQNAHIFDLLPENQISLARYIAQRYKFHMFVVHPNGIGKSDYVKKSDIDDIAIDDIGNVINQLKRSFTKPIYLMGHSTGAICFQTYLSGLSRTDQGNKFIQQIAIDRQQGIDGVFLLAGNVSMTDDNPNSELQKVARWGPKIEFLLKHLGWINARILTKVVSPTGVFGKLSIAFSKLWSFLYVIENVSDEARKAMYDKTLEGTSAPTLIQFSQGVINGTIQTTSGQQYKHGLVNFHVPAVQLTFTEDPLAVPIQTKRDSFDHLASQKKKFFVFQNEGHEDFMMNSAKHKNIDEAIQFILNP